MRKALILFALACGSVDEPLDDEALGQDAQAFTIQQSTTGATKIWSGVRWGNNHVPEHSGGGPNCNSAQGTAVDCGLPVDKTIVYRVLNGDGTAGVGPCSASDFSSFGTKVNARITQLNAALGVDGWTFSRDDNDQSADLALLCDGTTAVTGTNLADYMYYYLGATGVTQLTESLRGNWYSVVRATIEIRIPALHALGTTAANDDKLDTHAIGNAMIKAVGVGSGNSTGNVSTPTLLATGDTSQNLFSAGQLCRTMNMVVGGSSVTTSNSANCPNN
jgi:hypothetical protein